MGLIVNGCRAVCPDATEDEIVHFICQHAPRFQRMKQIDNPMGMLIRHLPKCFAGETFQSYRQAERQKREAEAVQAAAFRREQEQILSDPAASHEEKEWARQLLGLEGK